jgi:hypothetical protein
MFKGNPFGIKKPSLAEKISRKGKFKPTEGILDTSVSLKKYTSAWKNR